MNYYTLEVHLDTLCREQPKYANLYATWQLNKRSCYDMLKSVVIHYPYFSMHDISHAETIVARIEMLLGDRIKTLSPTDTWLLLHACYTHDLGMVLQWKQIENMWNESEFQDFLSSLGNSSDPELRDAAMFIQNPDNKEPTSLWPLKVYRYVKLINAAFFRGQHAYLSKICVKPNGENDGIKLDFGHNNLIQPRILKVLGDICEIHTSPTSEILHLDYQTNGTGSDYAHPRFIAMMLRLGDLLDIDNGRFNETCSSAFGDLPITSVPHKEKHEATTHLLVTPSEIQFRSDCPNSQAYLETRNFVLWLEDEVDFLTKHWSLIVPQTLGGYAPRFDKKELLIKGVPDIEGIAELRFEISQEKAFQIIEGTNIYEDRFTFIRELIQNAMDTSKFQLWRDLVSGNYNAWLSGNLPENIQPYDLEDKIYQCYPIIINLETLPDNRIQLKITDRGTGISVDTFKRMCCVGTSNYGTKHIQEEIQSMPNWLRPTAGFGIGLQSIFLVADQFEIDTGTGTESFHAVVHANRLGGHLQLQKSGKTLPRGTTISVCFSRPDEFSYSMSGDTENYLETQYDPFTGQDHTGEVRVLEAIRNNCGKSMFPLYVKCAEDFLEDFNQTENLLSIFDQNIKEKWKPWKERYCVNLSEDASRLQIWDKKFAAYGDFRMLQKMFHVERFSFKGININNNTPSLRPDGFSLFLDVYGLDTKNTLALNRTALTRKGMRNFQSILEDLFRVYVDYLRIYLNDAENEQLEKIYRAGKFNPYTLWLAYNFSENPGIPKDVLQHISEQTTIIVQDKEGKYIQSHMPVLEFINSFTEFHYINLRKFESFVGDRQIDYVAICEALNQSGINTLTVSGDKILTEKSHSLWAKTIQISKTNEHFMLYTVTKEEGALLQVEEHEKATLLKGLSNYIPSMDYHFYWREYTAKRYAVPAFEGYQTLAVDKIPFGVTAPFGPKCHYIIAPFVREEAALWRGLSKDAFVGQIMSSATFPNLVDYILHNSIQTELTAEEIRTAYKWLIEEYYDTMEEDRENEKETVEADSTF